MPLRSDRATGWLQSILYLKSAAFAKPAGIALLPKEELQALGKRARDRARRIGRQQQREMRGKAESRAASPARDNTGTEAKAQVLVDALRRVTAALRKLNAPTPAEPARKARAARAMHPPRHPGPGGTASKGMQPTPSRGPTVKTDPREIGRVSQAVKVAQAKRDR
jgi:hypothetical protein